MISTNENVGGSSSAQDFAQFVELQQKYTEASTQLDALEVRINESSQKVAQAHAADFIVLQETVAELDAQLKELFGRHPEWRGDKKSVSTPYGSVEQRTAKELQVPNPAMTVALIEAKGKSDPAFQSATFLHVTTEPNLEALERLSDETLAGLGITRVETQRMSVKPAKVNVAKAVKAAKQTKPA